MRLVVCTSTFPNPTEPNRGIYVYRRVRALAKKAAVSVLAPVPYFPKGVPSARYERYARIPSHHTQDGIPVAYPRVLVTPKIGRSLYGLSYALCLAGPMRRLLHSFQPEGLLAFWAYPDGFATVLLAKAFRLPVVVSAMGCDVNDLNQHFGKRRLVTWTFRHCDGAIAVSRAMRARVLDLGVVPSKVSAIPNGLDETYLAQSCRQHDAGSPVPAGPTVLFCGRLSSEKNPLGLMEAGRMLWKRRPDVRLKFVGDGPLRPQIEKQVEAWNVADRVTLVGEVHHDEVPLHMRQADVPCLPSLREGYPNVLLEALACGLPVVATDVGGVPEIITHEGLGIIVPVGRADVLAQALEAAVNRQWNCRTLQEGVRRRSWDDVGGDIFRAAEQAFGGRS